MLVANHPLILGVEHANMVLLVLTLGLSIVTFSSGRTNDLQGAVHLLLFVMFILLMVHRHEDEAARLVETHVHAPYFRLPYSWIEQQRALDCDAARLFTDRLTQKDTAAPI